MTSFRRFHFASSSSVRSALRKAAISLGRLWDLRGQVRPADLEASVSIAGACDLVRFRERTQSVSVRIETDTDSGGVHPGDGGRCGDLDLVRGDLRSEILKEEWAALQSQMTSRAA